jgi:hypothetical protein
VSGLRPRITALERRLFTPAYATPLNSHHAALDALPLTVRLALLAALWRRREALTAGEDASGERVSLAELRPYLPAESSRMVEEALRTNESPFKRPGKHVVLRQGDQRPAGGL